MSETPITDKLSTFLVTQFPATLGNLELHKHLCELERCERELNEAQKERDELKNKLCNRPAVLERDQWKAMAQEFGCAFHNYPNVPSHQKCLDTLSRFNELNKP